jgi:hypothetical protein
MFRNVGVALLLLFAVVCAQTAWLASDCGHEHSSQHCCGLCHAGPMAFVAPAILFSAAPVSPVEWVGMPPLSNAPLQALCGTGTSRAPPA